MWVTVLSNASPLGLPEELSIRAIQFGDNNILIDATMQAPVGRSNMNNMQITYYFIKL